MGRNVAVFVVTCLAVLPAADAQTPDTGLVGTLAPGEDTTELATRSRQAIVRDTRAVTVLDAEELEDRAPRSTPEALHAAAGVSVQKTNHGGGSPYVRGTTGQQVLLMIDGFRLSSSIMRSGPNQYLNTVDPLILDHIEVLRGSGSVLYGSDAIGGVVALTTRAPKQESAAATVHARGASADRSLGGRAELDAAFGPVKVLGGVGGAHFGDLRSGGAIDGTTVPQYDGDRQQFTSYDQLSGDAKIVVPAGTDGHLTAASIFFRQLDAPRTDKCSGPPLKCRYFNEQSFDIGYLRFSGNYAKVRELELGLAVTRTHERRNNIDTEMDRMVDETDDVHGLQLTARAATPAWRLPRGGRARLSYGVDGYLDRLGSMADTVELSTGDTTARVRGKYVDDSGYSSLAAFAFGELLVGKRLGFTAGLRVAGYRADVGADPEGGTPAFDQSWLVPVGSIGARVAITPRLSFIANIDQGFRAPNLDDLTARSSEGPGYQIGNPDLDAENALTFETGARVEHERFRLQLFGFGSRISDYIGQEATSCPTELSAECGGLENVYRLSNSDEATIVGTEAHASANIPHGAWYFGAFATLTWTRATRSNGDGDDQPMSKIPPLAGQLGLRAKTSSFFAEAIAAWARAQDRLSPEDMTDARIPDGGTPGYVAVDLRVGVMLADKLRATLALQNLTDTGYRVHGSGVDGAGFGVIAALAGTLPAP